MNLGHPGRARRLDLLAAEYALGTLSPRVRRRLAGIARNDARVAAAVHDWEQRLASLATASPPVTPPPRVWAGIAGRLGLSSSRASPLGWWMRLWVWRGLAMASTLAALALGILLLVESPTQDVVVVFGGADGRPVVIATAEQGETALRLKAVGPVEVAPDRSLELWALPDGAAPRSLGVVPSSGTGRILLPADALTRIPALAISLEPAGGSPTGAPTGPVLFSGKIIRI